MPSNTPKPTRRGFACGDGPCRTFYEFDQPASPAALPIADFALRREGAFYRLEPLSLKAKEFVQLNSTFGWNDDRIEARWIEQALTVVADNGLTVAGAL